MSPARNVARIVHDLIGRRGGKDRKGERGEGWMEEGEEGKEETQVQEIVNTKVITSQYANENIHVM